MIDEFGTKLVVSESVQMNSAIQTTPPILLDGRQCSSKPKHLQPQNRVPAANRSLLAQSAEFVIRKLAAAIVGQRRLSIVRLHNSESFPRLDKAPPRIERREQHGYQTGISRSVPLFGGGIGDGIDDCQLDPAIAVGVRRLQSRRRLFAPSRKSEDLF